MKKLSILCVLLLSTSIVITAQIQIKNTDEDATLTISADNHFITGINGPIFLVKIDTVEFELADSILSEINTDWIQSITVLKGSDSSADYDLYKGMDRIIITPVKSKEQEFNKWIVKSENRL
jgi:hypothetical protein